MSPGEVETSLLVMVKKELLLLLLEPPSSDIVMSRLRSRRSPRRRGRGLRGGSDGRRQVQRMLLVLLMVMLEEVVVVLQGRERGRDCAGERRRRKHVSSADIRRQKTLLSFRKKNPVCFHRFLEAVYVVSPSPLLSFLVWPPHSSLTLRSCALCAVIAACCN